jgi:hypothetical protein
VRVPYDRLGIPKEERAQLSREAPVEGRLLVASGQIEQPPDIRLAMIYVMAGDSEPEVRSRAEATIKAETTDALLDALSVRTHPKILEYLVQHRPEDRVLRTRIYGYPTMNDRTARMIALTAKGELVELVARHFERLLMTPKVYLDLLKNPACSKELRERTAAFLRMQRMLPDEEPVEDAPRVLREGQEGHDSFVTRSLVKVSELTTRNVQAEVEAALLGLASPFTNPDVADQLDIRVLEESEDLRSSAERFVFNFDDEAEEFSAKMTEDLKLDGEEIKTLTTAISEMNVGKKIKLAYLGNAAARKILLRDTNKSVSVAVVKSGRMSDSEAAAAASNKNLHGDVLREISSNREFLRKYNVKVALVNNPKCPIGVAMSIVGTLHRTDLNALSRNKNVPSVVQKRAFKMVKQRMENAQSGKE